MAAFFVRKIALREALLQFGVRYLQQSLPPPLLPFINAWFSVSDPHSVSRAACPFSGAAVIVYVVAVTFESATE